MWTPIRERGAHIVAASVLGMVCGQLIIHGSLDDATVIEVATMITTMAPLIVVLDHWINKAPISAPKFDQIKALLAWAETR